MGPDQYGVPAAEAVAHMRAAMNRAGADMASIQVGLSAYRARLSMDRLRRQLRDADGRLACSLVALPFGAEPADWFNGVVVRPDGTRERWHENHRVGACRPAPEPAREAVAA